MKKLDKVEYDKKYYAELHNTIFNTKYDDLFRDIIRARGAGYYLSNNITNVKQDGNKVSAVVKGSKDYHVSIELIDDNNIDVKCECPYHLETDKYCKHVYSLLVYLKMIYEKEVLINTYNINIAKIIEILDMFDKLVNDNKKDLRDYYSWAFNLKKTDENNLKYLIDNFDKDNIFRLISIVSKSYIHLNIIINNYNEVIDQIEECKKEFEERKRREELEEIRRKEEWEEESGFEGTIGEDLEENLDNFMASLPIEVLEYVRNEDIKNNRDTEIIDRVIKKHNELEELERLQQELELAEAERDNMYMKAGLLALLGGIFYGLSKIGKK